MTFLENNDFSKYALSGFFSRGTKGSKKQALISVRIKYW
jgi:hypothetical protein